MGYPPQYPPQYYAQQQPQYVTEDEVAQIVENAINEKLRQVLPQVLPQVFRQTIDKVNTLEREIRELKQRVDELAREINEIMRVVPDINRILPAVIESSVEGATKTTVGEAIRRAEEVASIVTAKVDELMKKGVSVDTSKLDAVLSQLNDTAGKLSRLSETMSTNLAVITKFANSAQTIMDELSTLSKKLNDMQNTINVMQNTIRELVNESTATSTKQENIEKSIVSLTSMVSDTVTMVRQLIAIMKGSKGSDTAQT
jgi:chromosome segregation ATPase